MRRALTLGGVTVGLGACAFVVLAGDLQPPRGAIAPTFKTIHEMEPRLPLNDETAPGNTTARHVITRSGSYYLTGDVFTETGTVAILIGAPDVSLDLRGFAVRGNGVDLGIASLGPSAQNITVRNGTVCDFGLNGISLATSAGVRLDGLTVSNCGDGSAGAGISTSGALISNCHVHSNTSGIVELGGGSIIGCVVRNNAVIGISLVDALVRGCNISGSFTNVVSDATSLIVDSRISEDSAGSPTLGDGTAR